MLPVTSSSYGAALVASSHPDQVHTPHTLSPAARQALRMLLMLLLLASSSRSSAHVHQQAARTLVKHNPLPQSSKLLRVD
jgi:hypothetical protein